MYDVCIVGHFAEGKNLLNGQTVKTKNLHRALTEKIGEEKIITVDTHYFGKNPLKILSGCYMALKSSRCVIVLPAYKGVRIIFPLMTILNIFFKRKIYYDVIGGWLPGFIKNKKILRFFLKNLTGIWTETDVMKKQLEKLGFNNVTVVPNFKFLTPVSEPCVSSFEKPYKLCTFARVMREKGIEDAVKAVNEINSEAGEKVITLDIYGSVENSYKEDFEMLKSSFGSNITYKGAVDSDLSVAVIKEYYLQLFPTLFPTEGIPGSIIDSFFAGTPVLSARWNSFDEIIEDGTDSFGFEQGNYDDFKITLNRLINAPDDVLSTSKAAINKAACYSVETVSQQILDILQIQN